MTLRERYELIIRLLNERRLYEAVNELRNFNTYIHDSNLTDDIENMAETYKNLIFYTREDIQDPERYNLFNALITKAYTLNDKIHDKVNGQSSLEQFYFYREAFQRKQQQTISDLQMTFESFVEDTAIDQLLNKSEENKNRQQRHDYEQIQLFQYIWTSPFWTDEDRKNANEFITSLIIQPIDKAIFISALTLSLLHAFDENKTLLLLSFHNHADTIVRMRALTGFAIVVCLYRKRMACYPKIQTYINLLEKEDYRLLAINITNIEKALIREKETDKISKIIQEEIMPQILAATQKGLRNPFMIDEEDLMDSSQTPEWNKKQIKNLQNRFYQISEWQQEGMDTNFSTFRHVKNTPFFTEITHWFTPFDIHSYYLFQVINDQNDIDLFCNFMTDNALICSSDLHSLCHMLLTMPANTFRQIADGLRIKKEELSALNADNSPQKKEQAIIQLYVQDLYRFFSLNRYRKEFPNPFEKVDFTGDIILEPLIASSMEQIADIGDLYFNHESYEQALIWYQKLFEKNDAPKADICQKIGFAYQKLAKYDEAIRIFQRADYAKPDDLWTIRHLAQCFRMKGDYSNAIKYYLQAEKADPDNQNLLIIIGECYLQTDNYEEAMKYLFKAQFQNPQSPKALRAAAWGTLLAGKYEQSAKFYADLFQLKNTATDVETTPQDYLNAGHLAWIMKEKKRATNLYIQGYRQSKASPEFLSQFAEDKKILMQRGIEAKEFPLMLEVIRACDI